MKTIRTTILVALALTSLTAIAQDRVLREKDLINDGKYVYANAEKKPYTGRYIKLDTDSTVLEEGQYVAGKTDGIWKEYHHNHALRLQREWKHGVLLSEIRYNNDGTLSEEKLWDSNGQIHGEWRAYNHGDLREVKVFVSGKLTSIKLYEKGTLIRTQAIN